VEPTPSNLLFDRQRTALFDLLALFEERRKIEGEVLVRLDQSASQLQKEAEETLRKLEVERDRELADLEAEFQNEHKSISSRVRAELAAEQRAHEEDIRRFDADETEARTKLEASLQDALWAADSFLEAGLKRVQKRQDEFRYKVEELYRQCEQLESEFVPLLNPVGIGLDEVQGRRKPPVARSDSLTDLEDLLVAASELVEQTRDIKQRRWLNTPIQVSLFLACLVVGAAPALFLEPWLFWLAGGIIVGLALGLLQRRLVKARLRRQVGRAGWQLFGMLAQVKPVGEAVLAVEAEAADTQRAGLQQQHAGNRQKAETRYHPQLEQFEERMRSQRQELEEKHGAEETALREQGLFDLKAAKQRSREAKVISQARHDQTMAQARTELTAQLSRLQHERTETSERMRMRWDQGCDRFLCELRELRQASASRPLDLLNGSSPATSVPTGLPLGTLALDLPALIDGMRKSSLAPLPAEVVSFPAFLPFPARSGLLLQAQSAGKAAAIQALQAMMLRYLTGLPPGKVRFTIVDPVGLGENFAAFMHLADHDEALVTSRIWTEPAHIEAQLAALTEHMENVIQKYLRSQFDSIEEYNLAAGEVAEPYRVLVVANFPVNFTTQAARRLVSIADSGASCGVHALVSADIRQVMPQGVSSEELSELCTCLRWDGSRFIWCDPKLEQFPLTLEAPPDNLQTIELARLIGARSREASRVEVPFSFIAPTPEDTWKSDSRRGITVPLGRAGAVRKLSLRLGQGTSQHVLVAGKTGSGKSTLWHALIVNLAMRYSTDEIEMYLIDFKKGVEFKLYAECQLPHARVIAIESEREFGLSVLQWLDSELRNRGDRFRNAGVNDLASYREARPDESCPRVLLIVDEFQEFFVEDDKLSQESALLLDRLVRQGRAFGLHIMLGSQTLGGVYSLARSTIDQMAVRIALQCSESDAQLILNKDNAAARLLSRPGEAIYNDASGALEGNEIFQVVWLAEEERERIVRSLHQRAATAEVRPHRPAIIFESNAPARLENNEQLQQTGQRDIPRAWLGEPIAIKEPTAALFRARSGSNLLIVGQHEESTLALLASSLVGLAVQHAPGTARFWMLDSMGVDEPMGQYLASMVEGWPHPVVRIARGEVTAALAGLAEEVQKRLKGNGGRERCYLLIHGLQFFRELRRSEDDFGMGRRGAEKTVRPDELFQTLLRDGPAMGVHLLMWCDQLTALNRILDRQGMRECGLRVLFQMSASDSSQLLDSPLASRLGRHRALFFHDEMPQPEKFRPYDLPSLAWIQEIQQRLVSVG
jgi:hypothetical protein